MGCSPPGDFEERMTHQSFGSDRTEGDTPFHGGGKISISPEGCQSAVGREVT